MVERCRLNATLRIAPGTPPFHVPSAVTSFLLLLCLLLGSYDTLIHLLFTSGGVRSLCSPTSGVLPISSQREAGRRRNRRRRGGQFPDKLWLTTAAWFVAAFEGANGAPPFVDEPGGTTNPGVHLDGTLGAVQRAGTALHTLVEGNNGRLFVVHGENLVGTDIETHATAIA